MPQEELAIVPEALGVTNRRATGASAARTGGDPSLELRCHARM